MALRRLVLKRTDVVEAALSYEGVPFRHMGRARTGLDCRGLLLAVAEDVGLYVSEEDRSHVYSEEPDGKLLRARLAEYMDVMLYEERLPGDVVLMLGTIEDTGFHACHLGIFIGPDEIIHALNRPGTRCVLRSPFLKDGAWYRKARGYFTWPNLH